MGLRRAGGKRWASCFACPAHGPEKAVSGLYDGGNARFYDGELRVSKDINCSMLLHARGERQLSA
jgi:hypothetical protein